MNCEKTAKFLFLIVAVLCQIACAPPSSRNSLNSAMDFPMPVSTAASVKKEAEIITPEESSPKAQVSLAGIDPSPAPAPSAAPSAAPSPVPTGTVAQDGTTSQQARGADQPGPSESLVTEVARIKTEILRLSSESGLKPDPDFSLQARIEPLVQELLQANPQPPVVDRIPLIDGTWHQEFGSLDYRNDKRGIDPQLEIREIYQVVSRNGYYYNVSPLYKNGDRSKIRIGFLRGEFKVGNPFSDVLDVRFTSYPGIKGLPKNGENIWDLAAKAESKTLENPINIVPKWVVNLFFGSGQLREVYTDRDMRITFGTRKGSAKRATLYVFTRVRPTASAGSPSGSPSGSME